MILKNLVTPLILPKFIVEVTQPLRGKECYSFYDEMFVCLSNHTFKNDKVLSIEKDTQIKLFDQCEPTSHYHLDYISHNVNRQNHQPYEFNRQHNSPNTVVFVLDTWVDVEHKEFQGRAQRGPAFVSGNSNYHGTHVSALIGGASVGTNPDANIVSIQVLDDSGYGSWSVIVKALEWLSTLEEPSFINISIGGSRSDIINKIINLMVTKGWRIVVAAGNDNQDACNISPASAALAVTVGSSNKKYTFSKFSNWGACVDLSAPGEEIVSAYPGNQYAMSTGTSMAAPIFTGIWSTFPELSEKQVRQQLVVKDLLNGLPVNTINKFSYNRETTCSFLQDFLQLVYIV